jgi:1-pyrroline-5-carboxylate dehydrogenase
MANGFFKVPKAVNEPVRAYAPGSVERENLLAMYHKMYNDKVDIPAYIGGEEIRTGKTGTIHPPHDINHTLGEFHLADKEHIEKAVDVALEARKKWS